MRDLPDMYAQAQGCIVPKGECIYIRQIPRQAVFNVYITLYFAELKAPLVAVMTVVKCFIRRSPTKYYVRYH